MSRLARLTLIFGWIVIVAVFACVLLLTGCGGGGDETEDAKPDQTIDLPDCKAPERCK